MRLVQPWLWRGLVIWGFGSLNSFELHDGKYILEIGNSKQSTSNSYYGAGFETERGEMSLLPHLGKYRGVFCCCFFLRWFIWWTEGNDICWECLLSGIFVRQTFLSQSYQWRNGGQKEICWLIALAGTYPRLHCWPEQTAQSFAPPSVP